MKWMEEISDDFRREVLFWLLSREVLDIPHVDFAGTDTNELEFRMKDISWGYAFYDPLEANTEVESAEDRILFDAIEEVVIDLQKLEAMGGIAEIASKLLQIKFWQGQHMEIQISHIDQRTFEYPEEQDIPKKFLKRLYERLKAQKMKEETFNYLSNEIKFGGFDEKLIPYLQEALEKGEDKFQLFQETQIGKDQVSATLNFKKSNTNDHYYFNDFTLKILPGGDEDKLMILHVPRGRDTRFTLKQGYNIAMERAVGFVQINDQNQASETWAMLDRKFTYEDGSPQIKSLPVTYRYKIEDVLSKYSILELYDEDQKTQLLQNIRRGNLTEAVAERSDGIHVKVKITAHPLGRAIHMYDATNGEKLNAKLFLAQGQSQTESKEQNPRVGTEEMEAPDLPESKKTKKPTR